MKWDELVQSMTEQEFTLLCDAILKRRYDMLKPPETRGWLPEPNDHELELWNCGQGIQAVKSLRKRTTCGLKEAKDILEARTGRPLTVSRL